MLAALIVTLGGLTAARTWQRWTTLPTDALEARAFAPIVQSLPAGHTVFFVGVSGLMWDEMPLYQRCTGSGARRDAITVGQPTRRIVPGDYWFRAATCSTTLGRPFCDAIEAGLVLRPVHIERFPARQSLDDLPYDRREVVSGLYRVEAIREQR